MLTNIDLDLSGINFADGMTIARLTSYADEPINIGLEDLGKLYVDIDSKFAGKAIRELMQRIKSVRWNAMKKKLKEILPKDISVIDVTKAWEKRVNFINNQYDEYFPFIEENFTQPTYKDVYIENENLMVCYAADDVVVLLEYLEKAFPVLEKSYDLENANVFNQECQLIEVVASMERNGIKADINYLIASRLRVKQYIDEVYAELWDLTKRKYGTFSSGQHKVIMQIMFDEYNIFME